MAYIFAGKENLINTVWKHSDDNMFIVIMTPEGEFISEASNRAQEKTFHLEPHQLDGMNIKDLLDEVTYKSITTRYKECIKLNAPITYEESATIDDSGVRYYSTTILPVKDDESENIGIFGISREITPLKRAEQALKDMNENLEERIAKRTAELLESNKQLQVQAFTDPLTQCSNRRYFFEQSHYLFNQSLRNQTPLSIMMIDVDNFKMINDKFGHPFGDEILIKISSILKRSLRNVDLICRYGGDEFMMIMPNSTALECEKIAQRIRLYVQEIECEKCNQNKSFSVSIGIVESRSDDDVESLIKKVDTSLYNAKAAGKNFISLHEQI